MPENKATQRVRIVVEGLAGNITDTASESFTSAYRFEDEITISTNGFVCWYANKILVWSTILVNLFSGVSIVLMLAHLKKKRKS